MKKKLSLFSIILILYSVLILIGGAYLLHYLWGRLASYQVSYEKAEAAANPDLIMDEYTSLFYNDNIRELAGNLWDDISIYETEENIAGFITDHVSDEKIRWERRDDFSNLRPKYDIYSGENYVGAVELKQKKAVDEYGFHMCELDHAEVGFVPEGLKIITINAYDDASVYVNGQLLKDKQVSSAVLDNTMDKKAADYTGKEYKINTYELSGFFEFPDVKIERNGYVCDFAKADEEDHRTVSQLTMYDSALFDEVSERALEIAKAYDLYAANIREIGSVSPYFIYTEKGYKMLAGISYDLTIAGTTTVFDILDSSAGNMLAYSPDDVVIDTHQSIHRVFRNNEYDENIDIRWYLRRVNEKWKVCDFSMKL